MVLRFLPNEADATFDDQAEPDSVDFEILLLGHQRTGVVSGCEVTESASVGMKVDIAVGVALLEGVSAAVALQIDETIATADGSNPRVDIVSVDSGGNAVVTTGTAAAQPVAPSLPANVVPLAFVYVPTSDTTITDNQINDKRVILPPEFVSGRAAYSIDTPPLTIDAHVDSDEFDDGVLDPAWVWHNQLSTTAVESAEGRYLRLEIQNTTNGFRSLDRTAPSTPYTWTVKMDVGGEFLDFNQVGVGFRETSSGKLIVVTRNHPGAGGPSTEILKMTDFDTYSSSPFLDVDVGNDTGPMYFQLEDDGTDIFFRIGSGVTWMELFKEARGTFFTTAPDEVGLMVAPPDTTPGRPTEQVYHWARFDWTAEDSLKIPLGESSAIQDGSFRTVDTPPRSPDVDSLNDEFDDGVLDSAWEWINQGATATATEDNDGKFLRMDAGSTTPAGHTLRLLSHAVPSTPWTFTAKVNAGGSLTNFASGGISFRETSSSKLINLMISRSTDAQAVLVIKSTDPNTGSTTEKTLDIGESAGDHYLQLEDDGTDLIFLIGDGVTWTELFRETRGTWFTTGPDRVCLELGQESTTPNREAEAVFHWARFNWTAVDSLKHAIGGVTDRYQDTWLDALFFRPSDEAVHVDDQEFTGALGGTEVVTTGTVTWEQKQSVLSVRFANLTANDIASQVYALTATTAPITIDVTLSVMMSEDNHHQAGVLFSDGVTSTDSVVVAGIHRSGAVLINRGTFTNVENTELATHTPAGEWNASPTYLRLVYVSANNWQFLVSPDGVLYTDFDLGDQSFTMAPTHFGVYATTWGDATTSVASWHYLRVTDADLSL